jgi:hypothetical protein
MKMKQYGQKFVVVTVLLVGIMLITNTSISAVSPLQSVITKPKVVAAPNNPKYVYAMRGDAQFECFDPSDQGNEPGRWLAIPIGFTAESGAEIHCDLNPVLPAVEQINKRLFALTWDKRGYLIGLYPRNPLLKPLDVVFVVDATQAQNVCATCFVGRYYDPLTQRWRNLPTTYSKTTTQVTVKITSQLPASGFPAYADRVLIALFTKRV